MNKESIEAMFREAGWTVEIEKPSYLHSFQVIGMRGQRGLSVVAGEGLYSDPRCLGREYSAVEVGFLLHGLRYCRPGSPWFVGDVEGWVEEEKLQSMIDRIMELKPDRTRRCPDCGKTHALPGSCRCLRCRTDRLLSKMKEHKA